MTPDASQMPPQPQAPKWLPNASQMAPKCFPSGFQKCCLGSRAGLIMVGRIATLLKVRRVNRVLHLKAKKDDKWGAKKWDNKQDDKWAEKEWNSQNFLCASNLDHKIF